LDANHQQNTLEKSISFGSSLRNPSQAANFAQAGNPLGW
jgi:hypothetical protein